MKNKIVFLVFYLLLLIAPLMLDSPGGEVSAFLFNNMSQLGVSAELLFSLVTVIFLIIALYVLLYFVFIAATAVALKFAGLSQSVVLLIAVFVLTQFVWSMSAELFPSSEYTAALISIVDYLLPFWFWVCVVSFVFFLAIWFDRLWKIISIAVAIALCLLNVNDYFVGERIEEKVATNQSNIILIGIDSLSAAAYELHSEELLNIESLVGQGTYYRRAYTNFGRTYPAWISLLSGTYPSEHGAFFNLRLLSKSKSTELITHKLGFHGYHRVFALDERRFNNMDERFGFDVIVGPKAGALSFIVPSLTDNPIANLLLQSRITQWLFPWSRNNAGAVSSYSADSFVDEVLSSVSTTNSNFLAVHFESSHFPYKTRHAELAFNHENHLWEDYIKALHVVDGQVGRLIRGLEKKGALENALIIIFSDHGEAVGEIEASLQIPEGEMILKSYGHGADLLSDHQNRILLGMTHFRDGRPVKASAVSRQQVSLLDIRPAIEQFLLADLAAMKPKAECLFVETGLRIPAAEDFTKVSNLDVALQGVYFYKLTDGFMHLREDRLKELILLKDIGLRCQDRITLLKAYDARFYTYLLSETGLPIKMVDLNLSDKRKIQEFRTAYANKKNL